MKYHETVSPYVQEPSEKVPTSKEFLRKDPGGLGSPFHWGVRGDFTMMLIGSCQNFTIDLVAKLHVVFPGSMLCAKADN